MVFMKLSALAVASSTKAADHLLTAIPSVENYRGPGVMSLRSRAEALACPGWSCYGKGDGRYISIDPVEGTRVVGQSLADLALG